MTLIEAIREAFWEAMRSAVLPELLYATYSLQGLIVDPTQPPIPFEKTDIPAVFTEQGMKVQCPEVQGSVLTLKDPLAEGDIVAVIRHHKGQRYSILYKV